MKRAQTTGYHGCQRFNASKALDFSYVNFFSLFGDTPKQQFSSQANVFVPNYTKVFDPNYTKIFVPNYTKVFVPNYIKDFVSNYTNYTKVCVPNYTKVFVPN